MATIGDLKDIMQVSGGPEAAAPPTKKKKASSRPKRQETGLTRELYALMGDNAPPITLALPKLKEKPKLQRKVQHWELRPFKNAARTDDLQLSSWVPKAVSTDEPYRFAGFNTAPSPNLFTYTADEYNRFLRSETDWTREETDYLFNMCRHYDLRFIVIHDRWSWKSTPNRSLEDLKERYYGCCKRLIQNRPQPDETAKSSGASQFSFDKNREVNRKKYLRSLMQRTPAQIAEEEHLYIESRKLEQTYTRVSRERDDLLRMFGGPGASAASNTTNAAAAPGIGVLGLTAGGANVKNTLGASQAAAGPSRSRRGARYEEEVPMGGKAGGKGKAKSIPVDPEFDALHNIVRFDPSQGPAINAFGLPKTASNIAGVYLRSTRIPPIKPSAQAKVHAILQEMHITQKLVMPTRANAEKLESLVSAVALLVETKKQADRAEYERGVALNREVAANKGEFAYPEDNNDAAAADRNKRSMSVSTTTSEQRPTKRRKK